MRPLAFQEEGGVRREVFVRYELGTATGRWDFVWVAMIRAGLW